jgi:hypothetical protein
VDIAIHPGGDPMRGRGIAAWEEVRQVRAELMQAQRQAVDELILHAEQAHSRAREAVARSWRIRVRILETWAGIGPDGPPACIL